MFALDLPPEVPAQYSQVVVAPTPQAQSSKAAAERTIGVCALIENQEASRYSAVNAFEPIRGAVGYFRFIEKKEVAEEGKVTLLIKPKNGTLEAVEDTKDAFFYIPTSTDYRGTDSATFLVELGGHKVQVVYWFNVLDSVGGGTEGSDPYDRKDLCPKGGAWKISLSDIDATSSLAGFVSPTSPLNYPLKQVDVSLNFANLANGAVGETVGHSITLDDDGAGHGWFIDSTPELNDEFLPTSNPNEWIAKPGSEAAGKMDLLTVLLHEYGHALGLNHDESTHQLMSDELQPGVRRTVSDAEMAKLWSLLSDPLVVENASTPLSDRNSAAGIGGGSDPSAPFNPLPLSISFMFGFARRRIDTTPAAQGMVLPPLAGNDPNAVTINPMLGAAPSLQEPQYELATHSGVFN